MADAHGSGPCARKGVGVQLPPFIILKFLQEFTQKSHVYAVVVQAFWHIRTLWTTEPTSAGWRLSLALGREPCRTCACGVDKLFENRAAAVFDSDAGRQNGLACSENP